MFYSYKLCRHCLHELFTQWNIWHFFVLQKNKNKYVCEDYFWSKGVKYMHQNKTMVSFAGLNSHYACFKGEFIIQLLTPRKDLRNMKITKWHHQRHLQMCQSLTKISYFYLKWSLDFNTFMLWLSLYLTLYNKCHPQHTHTALFLQICFTGILFKKYIDQMSPPENKKCSPGKVFAIKPPSNPWTFEQERP